MLNQLHKKILLLILKLNQLLLKLHQGNLMINLKSPFTILTVLDKFMRVSLRVFIAHMIFAFKFKQVFTFQLTRYYIYTSRRRPKCGMFQWRIFEYNKLNRLIRCWKLLIMSRTMSLLYNDSKKINCIKYF